MVRFLLCNLNIDVAVFNLVIQWVICVGTAKRCLGWLSG